MTPPPIPNQGGPGSNQVQPLPSPSELFTLGAPTAPTSGQLAEGERQFRGAKKDSGPRLGFVRMFTINPFPVKLTHGQLGGRVIPGRPPDEPFGSHKIEDRLISVYMGDSDGVNFRHEQKVVPAESIVNDYLGRFRHLGIFAVPESSTVEIEAERARKLLERTWNQAFTKAERQWQKKPGDRSRISKLAHQACEALGRKAPWHEEPGQSLSRTAPCPFCGGDVIFGKPKCPKCGETIDPNGLQRLREAAKRSQGGLWGDQQVQEG